MSDIPKLIMWATVIWVILVNYPKKSVAEQESITLNQCITSVAGPICATSAATG